MSGRGGTVLVAVGRDGVMGPPLPHEQNPFGRNHASTPELLRAELCYFTNTNHSRKPKKPNFLTPPAHRSTLNRATLSWRTPSMQNYRHCNIYMPEVLNYLSLLQLISYFRPMELWSCNAGSCSAAYLGRWALACCERGV